MVKVGLTLRVLKIATESWPVSGEFRISRSTLSRIELVTVTLTQDGYSGRGECRPYVRYGETPASVTQQIERIRDLLCAELSLEDLQDAMPAGAARNAVDCALWDLKAKMTGRSIADLIGLPAPKRRQTAFTLSVDTPENMRDAAIAAKVYPLLKIKIGDSTGLEAAQLILKARPDAMLIIDANEALRPEELRDFRSSLAEASVALIEQPLPDAIFDKIDNRPKAKPIYCADESMHGLDDLNKLWRAGYRAVNVKLDKCGGLSAGLEVIKAAKARGFITMAGCMVGTSLAMAPMMMLESFADYIDLDGPLLLAKDRKKGLRYEGPIIHPPQRDLWG